MLFPGRDSEDDDDEESTMIMRTISGEWLVVLFSAPAVDVVLDVVVLLLT